MKSEYNEIMALTPKRKSILWRYKSDEDDSIFVYGISKGRALTLSGEFAVSKEEVLKNKEEVKLLGANPDINDGGISVLFEDLSAKIWELCDGSNTLKDIVDYITKEYDVDYETATRDCVEFLTECDQKNVIDINWRSLI